MRFAIILSLVAGVTALQARGLCGSKGCQKESRPPSPSEPQSKSGTSKFSPMHKSMGMPPPRKAGSSSQTGSSGQTGSGQPGSPRTPRATRGRFQSLDAPRGPPMSPDSQVATSLRQPPKSPGDAQRILETSGSRPVGTPESSPSRSFMGSPQGTPQRQPGLMTSYYSVQSGPGSPEKLRRRTELYLYS